MLRTTNRTGTSSIDASTARPWLLGNQRNPPDGVHNEAPSDASLAQEKHPGSEPEWRSGVHRPVRRLDSSAHRRRRRQAARQLLSRLLRGLEASRGYLFKTAGFERTLFD